MVLMMARPAEKAQRIRDALECPACSYSLRGLAGDVVTCPECGHECNIVAMMTRQWTGQWYDAPGFNRLLWPLAVTLIASMFGLIVWVFEQAADGTGLISVATFAAIFVVWGALLLRVRDVPTPGAGIPLAVLAHGLFAGYITGIVIIVWSIVATFSAPNVFIQMIFVGLIGVGVALFWFMRRGEKYIAQRCIEAWVNLPGEECTAGSAMDSA